MIKEGYIVIKGENAVITSIKYSEIKAGKEANIVERLHFSEGFKLMF
jgi:hypothetical protein